MPDEKQAKKQAEYIQSIAEVHPPAHPEIPYCGDIRYFFTHPTIQRIADLKRWTFSGNTTKSAKVPLDLWWYKDMGRMCGAKYWDENYLGTLKEAWRGFYPAFQNSSTNVPLAFYLDCYESGLVCLDIEPTCDPELRNKFLRLPFIYGDFSLSGKGFHLLFDLPKEILDKYPNAQNKLKMRPKSAEYEILLCHYMTFTENMLYASPNPLPIQEFYSLFEELCQQQQKTTPAASEFAVDMLEPNQIPNFNSLHPRIVRGVHLTKTKNDFESVSEYEFGIVSKCMSATYAILHMNPPYIKGHKYTNQEILMLVYYVAKDFVPYREKHDTYRDGMPWLMHMAYRCCIKNPFYPPEKPEEPEA